MTEGNRAEKGAFSEKAFRGPEFGGVSPPPNPALISKTFPDNQIACTRSASALQKRPEEYLDMSPLCGPYNHLFGMKALLLSITTFACFAVAGFSGTFESHLVSGQQVDKKWADDSGRMDHRIFTVWELSAPDGEVLFVRGFLEGFVAPQEINGVSREESEVFVSPTEMTGTLTSLKRGGTEVVKKQEITIIPIHWPGGFHYIPQTSALSGHGPQPLSVGIFTHRETILALVRARDIPIGKIHGVFCFPAFSISDDHRSFRRACTFQLEVDFLISEDQNTVTVDVPVISIDFPPFKLDEEEDAPNKPPLRMPVSDAPAASASAKATADRGAPVAPPSGAAGLER